MNIAPCRFLRVLCLVAFGGSVFSPFALRAAATEDAPSVLRWGADAEGGAPYMFKDPDHPTENIGYEKELADAMARELRCEIEFVQYQFSSLIPGLDRRDFDFAMNGFEVTPDRERAVRFSHPYYVYTLQLVARANEMRFGSLDECRAKGAVVGTLEDTAAERLLDQLHINKKIYDSVVEPYNDLELGRLDAVLLDLPIAVYYAKPNPKLKFVGKPTGKGYYAIAFRREDAALCDRVNNALASLSQDGTLRKIYEKWGLWNADQEGLFRSPAENNAIRPADSRWTFWEYFPLLLQGALVTIEVTVASMCLAIAIGLPVALMRLSRFWLLRLAATLYVEFFRGIPVLLLLFFLYYGLPPIGEHFGLGQWLNLSAFAAAVVGFGLNYGAYESEIYRAGIGSIPVGQWEAAASLGMSNSLTFRRIILPQAIRVILPPMTNDFIALFKDTSLVSVIAVVELTKEYQILAKSSMRYLEIGLATAMLYLVMSVPLGYLARHLEKRWGKGL